MQINKLSTYKLDEIENIFRSYKNTIAYGAGSIYKQINKFFDEMGLSFSHVVYNEGHCFFIDELRENSIERVKEIFDGSVVFLCTIYSEEVITKIQSLSLKPHNIVTINVDDIANYPNSYKQWLARSMQNKHKVWLRKFQSKKKIKVVFLAINKSVWKVDSVFRKMLCEPYFDPVILICPYTAHGEECMWNDMQEAKEYFEAKDYSVVSSYNKYENRWLKLEEIQPDIVFFTNPHNLTRKEYYEDAYLNYLSCYVPYAHDVSKYSNYAAQYNQNFHMAMWKIFVPHYEDFFIFKNYSTAQGYNVAVTGYPACEELLSSVKVNPWNNSNRIKIIWAPHHTIDDPDLPYSNFLDLATFFIDLVLELGAKVQFAFKPHPILKLKLYLHKDWGKFRTDSYYNFWEKAENTQLELGEYADLFKYSDAMVHDSGSFLAEYHYVKKPVFYIADENNKKYLNEFGVKAMNACMVGKQPEQIRKFICQVIDNEVKADTNFFDKEIIPFFKNEIPSEKILKIIKQSFTVKEI